jgi:two-component sensor histidine kinase
MTAMQKSQACKVQPQGLRLLGIYTSCVSLLGAALLLWALKDLRGHLPGILLFMGLVVIAELLTSETFAPQIAWSVSTAVTFAMLLLYGQLAGALGSMLGGLIATLVVYAKDLREGRSRSTSLWQRALFNMAALGLSVFVAGAAYGALGGSVGDLAMPSSALPLALAALASECANAALVVVAVALQTGMRPLHIWRQNVSWAIPINVLSMTVVGAGLAIGYQIAGLLGIGAFLLPLLLTIYLFRSYVARTKEQVEKLEESIAERERAQRALEEAQEQLEKRVRERTAELAMLNNTLQEEVAERKQAEVRITASLNEKEALLNEVHHRVKNNLQAVCSLLHLQSRDVQNREARRTLQESRNRVRAMALVHEKLYRSGNLARVDFAEYIRSLTSSLVRSFGVDSNAIRLHVEIDQVFLSIDYAVPCGLIVNELVHNALKHAFPDRREGEIRISCHQNDEGLVLQISDNGAGIPADPDLGKTNSLGLQLVRTLVEQLDGSIEVSNSAGTDFRIVFSLPEQGERVEA